jgi:hypothetical protein
MHKHHDDCKHRHEHTDKCQHGTPTAKPRGGICHSCGALLGAKTGIKFCQVHRAWECQVHVDEGTHHDREKAAKFRAEQYKEV